MTTLLFVSTGKPPVEISSQVEKHSGVVDSYLQITSPVRRYLDSINMRQSPFSSKQQNLYNKDELDSIYLFYYQSFHLKDK